MVKESFKNIIRLLRKRLVQHFWRKWHLDVLREMQKRVKWQNRFNLKTIRIGQLALMHVPNANYFQWPLARIINVHPDPHGEIRVVTLKTASGATYKRPVYIKYSSLSMPQSVGQMGYKEHVCKKYI